MIGGFEDAVERGQSAVKKSAKQTASDFGSTVKGQITGSQNTVPTDNSGNGTNEQASAGQNQQQDPQMTDADRVEFLKNLYGKSDHSSKTKNDKPKLNNSGPITQVLGVPQKDPNEGKTPEEIAKIQALRSQLHQDYYQETFNRPKPKEESVTEKLEREEQTKQFEDLEEKKKKPAPLPATVKQGTGESVVGISG
jgi:hypothetical protein